MIKVEDLVKDPEEVMYVIIPTLIVYGGDDYIRIMFEWLDWGFGITIRRRLKND